MAERMNLCDVAKEHLLPWLAGRLDGTPEGQAFEAHVRECKSCSGLVTDRRQAMQALLALADESGTVTEAAPQETAPAKQIQPPSWRALVQSKGTAILTVAAALLLVFSYFMKPSEGLLGEKALPAAPEQAKQPSEETNTEATETSHAVEATAEGETESAPATQEQPGEKAVVETPPQPSPQAGREPAKAAVETPRQPSPQAGREPAKAVVETPRQPSPQASREGPPATRKASPKRRPAPPVKTTPAPSKRNKRNAGTVEVFDESGRLIGSATTGGQK